MRIFATELNNLKRKNIFILHRCLKSIELLQMEYALNK